MINGGFLYLAISIVIRLHDFFFIQAIMISENCMSIDHPRPPVRQDYTLSSLPMRSFSNSHGFILFFKATVHSPNLHHPRSQRRPLTCTRDAQTFSHPIPRGLVYRDLTMQKAGSERAGMPVLANSCDVGSTMQERLPPWEIIMEPFPQ